MVQLKDKTCFLPSGASIFGARSDMIFAGGRSTWTSILSDTFSQKYLQRLFSSEGGSAFSDLLHFTTVTKELCLLHMTATIFHYLWILAQVTMHDNIQPSWFQLTPRVRDLV
ncbi:hypothetical protein BJX70DRAFT_337418 [Aspergillus crustosus]